MMRELSTGELRALINLIPPLRALREDVEKAIHLELHQGSGDLVVRSLEALTDQAARITGDAYIKTLTIDLPEGTKDRVKFAQALIVTGQLLAFLEAITGTAGISADRKGSYSVQTAPNISLNMGDVMGGEIDRVMDVVRGAMSGIPRPPKAPKPPRPPRPPRDPHAPDVEKLKRDVLRYVPGMQAEYDQDEEDEDEEV